METRAFLALAVAAVAVPVIAAAQEVRVYSAEPGARAYSFITRGEENRAVIGVTTSTGSARDTLGVLVTSVTSPPSMSATGTCRTR
jgi:hypothetical protein